MSLGTDMLTEIVRSCYYEMKKPRNEKKIKHITHTVTKYILEDFKFQINVIVGILVLIFVMNCVQFYFYITNVLPKFIKH